MFIKFMWLYQELPMVPKSPSDSRCGELQVFIFFPLASTSNHQTQFAFSVFVYLVALS